jgi:hypothetical protein
MGAGLGKLRRAPDFRRLIDTQACVAQHHPAAGWSVTLSVETTRDEVVDVAAAAPSPVPPW